MKQPDAVSVTMVKGKHGGYELHVAQKDMGEVIGRTIARQFTFNGEKRRLLREQKISVDIV